jgi:hypothetical protein
VELGAEVVADTGDHDVIEEDLLLLEVLEPAAGEHLVEEALQGLALAEALQTLLGAQPQLAAHAHAADRLALHRQDQAAAQD